MTVGKDVQFALVFNRSVRAGLLLLEYEREGVALCVLCQVVNMVDSGFIEFKLDYQKTRKLALGHKLSKSIRAGEHTLTVDCYPRGLFGGNYPGDDLPLHLFLAIKSKNINLIFEAFVVGKDGAPSPSHAKRTVAFESIVGGGTRHATLFSFLKQSDLESLCAANGGVVTVVCGVILRHDENPITVPAPNIGVHLRDMMGCTDGSDVSFSVGRETFHAHRAMLAARSPVFKAELFGSMAESKLPCVTVCGIEPSIFKALPHFIYT